MEMATAPQEQVESLDAEITCPLCEGTSVEEVGRVFECLCCGESWMYISMGA